MDTRGLCPVIGTITIIGKKWPLIIVHSLTDGPKRFNELKRSMNGVSSKTLSMNLAGLVEEEIIARRVYSESPIRVEYSLTEKGEDLKELLQFMTRWGEKWLVEPSEVES